MKIALALVVLSLVACSHPPTAPDSVSATPPGSTSAKLWGMVIDQSGVCLAGATVAVVTGQAAAQSQTQETPCDVWGYGGGFTLTGLNPGVSMTLRASAPGYATRDIAVTPSASQSTVFEIVLTRTQ
jgi:hypothetical protein